MQDQIGTITDIKRNLILRKSNKCTGVCICVYVLEYMYAELVRNLLVRREEENFYQKILVIHRRIFNHDIFSFNTNEYTREGKEKL